MTKAYASVWDAVADTPEEAADLCRRAELMRQIAGVIKGNGWREAEAAAKCGVTQPRMSDLLRGRISRFSLNDLTNIDAALQTSRSHLHTVALSLSSDLAKEHIRGAYDRKAQRSAGMPL